MENTNNTENVIVESNERSISEKSSPKDSEDIKSNLTFSLYQKLKDISDSFIGKTITSGVLIIIATLFYQLGYSFLYGYYFGNSISHNISIFDIILNQIPFDFKYVAALGIVVFFFFFLFTYLVMQIADSSRKFYVNFLYSIFLVVLFSIICKNLSVIIDQKVNNQDAIDIVTNLYVLIIFILLAGRIIFLLHGELNHGFIKFITFLIEFIIMLAVLAITINMVIIEMKSGYLVIYNMGIVSIIILNKLVDTISSRICFSFDQLKKSIQKKKNELLEVTKQRKIKRRESKRKLKERNKKKGKRYREEQEKRTKLLEMNRKKEDRKQKKIEAQKHKQKKRQKKKEERAAYEPKTGLNIHQAKTFLVIFILTLFIGIYVWIDMLVLELGRYLGNNADFSTMNISTEDVSIKGTIIKQDGDTYYISTLNHELYILSTKYIQICQGISISDSTYAKLDCNENYKPTITVIDDIDLLDELDSFPLIQTNDEFNEDWLYRITFGTGEKGQYNETTRVLFGKTSVCVNGVKYITEKGEDYSKIITWVIEKYNYFDSVK